MVAEDVRARMDFGLRCAFAHGTGAIRTHLDSLGAQTAISWPVFAEMREAWRDRIALQATALFPIDLVASTIPTFRAVVAHVVRYGGVLGGVTYLGTPPDEATDRALDVIVRAAPPSGLDLDFHVDESGAPRGAHRSSASLTRRSATISPARSCAGIAARSPCRAEERSPSASSRSVAEAGIAVVSLPMCNMYLQDRRARPHPALARRRAAARARGGRRARHGGQRQHARPFYAYGDLDMLEVLREATRILHLDHPATDWLRAVARDAGRHHGPRPARRASRRATRADLVLLRARNLTELLARPQTDRTVLRRRARASTPLRPTIANSTD